MAQQDLIALLIKCLRNTFLGADLSSGSAVWTGTIQPMVDFLGPSPLDLPVRPFLQSILRTKFPGTERDKDSVLDDLALKPMEAMLAPVIQEIKQIRPKMTLADPRQHTIDSISALASNFGIVTSGGDYARGSVRLYYAAPVNERATPESHVETGTGLRFYASSTQTVSAAMMQLNMDGDLFYWDIDVVAENAGPAYNVPPGAIARAPSFNRVVKTANLYSLSNGLGKDTVDTIVAELDNYPCTRSIGTRRGTVATILSLLGGARVIEVVGMGDVEMNRDIIRGGDVGRDICMKPAWTTQQMSSATGVGIPDGYAGLTTGRMYDVSVVAPNSFIDFFGSTGPSTGYYMILQWSAGGSDHWAITKVINVIDGSTVELEDRIAPLSFVAPAISIHWVICPAQLTLSKVPGGILWPDTSDGEVIILDNEVHVGGCTDSYLLGSSIESTSVDVGSLTDEDPVGYGIDAETGDPTTPLQLITLNDAPETVVFGPAAVTQVGASAVYEFDTHFWTTEDLSAVRAGQVLDCPTLPPPNRYLIIGVERVYPNAKLAVRLDAIPGAGAIASVSIIKRGQNLGQGSSIRLFDSTDSGGAAETTADGYYRILAEFEGFSFDTSTDGCAYKVWTERLPNATGTGPFPVTSKWRWSDDIDINLSDPKIVRTSSSTLLLFSGSDVVSDATTDFSIYGVVQGDVLRITSGASAGDYVLSRDPFGPGNTQLQVNRVMRSSGFVAYQVFAPSTPVTLPVLSVTRVSLLDADGAPQSVDIPYGEPLGAYSEQFSNIANGTKYETAQAITGIHTTTGILLDASVLNWTPAAQPMRLWLWHSWLGFFPWGGSTAAISGSIPLDNGALLVPTVVTYNDAVGPFDLTTVAGWDDAVAYLNQKLPYPFWDWNHAALGGYGYLKFNPMGCHLAMLGLKTAGMMAPFDFGHYLGFSYPGSAPVPIDVSTPGYYNCVTTQDVYVPDNPYDLSPIPVALGSDLVGVFSGSNTGMNAVLMNYDPSACRRWRVKGYHPFNPEMTSSVRFGAASSSVVRTYFRDPTDFEVGQDSRFTVEDDGTLVYWPDPTLRAVRVPHYPDTVMPDNGWVDNVLGMAAGALFHFHCTNPTASNLLTEGVVPGDLLDITYRDVIFTRVAWPHVVPADEELIITERGKAAITVTFAAGTYNDLPLGAGEIDPTVTINTAFGSTIAYWDATNHVRLRWQNEITFSGSATTVGNLLNVAVVSEPAADNNALSKGTYLIWDVQVEGAPLAPTRLVGYWGTGGGTPSGSDGTGDRVQYKILRQGVQRITAMEMVDNVGTGGLYYADIELLSYGVGDEYNIREDRKMLVSGHRCRGYRLSCDNKELSFSTAETLWLHADNYFQPTTATDDSFSSDQAIFGSGIRLYYDRSPLVSSAQALLNSGEERDNNQSSLARHLLPHYVSFEVGYAGGPLESVALPELQDLIVGRSPKEPLDVSDIIGKLTQLGANHVDTPVELAVVRHNEDRTQDVLIGKDRVESSRLSGFLVGNLVLNRWAG